MPDALSLSRTDLPEEIATAIEELAFAYYSHGLGVGDGTLHQIEPRRSAEAHSALTAAILSRLREAEAGREEAWQDKETAIVAMSRQLTAALARVERLEKALEDLKDAFHEDSDAYAKISAALSSPAATEEG